MKRIIYLMMLILVVLTLVSCQNKQDGEKNQKDQPVISQSESDPQKNISDEDKNEPEEHLSKSETIYPKVTIDKKDLQEIGKMKNWEIASNSLQMVGKPVKEISTDYLQWTFIDAAMGAVYYEDLSTGLYYIFPAVKSLPDYVENTLSGDEICTGVAGSIQYFFPYAEWPGNIEETKDYLNAHLGISFELIDARDTEGTYSYKAEFPVSKNYAAFIWTEDAVVTSETWIEFVLQTLEQTEPFSSEKR